MAFELFIERAAAAQHALDYFRRNAARGEAWWIAETVRFGTAHSAAVARIADGIETHCPCRGEEQPANIGARPAKRRIVRRLPPDHPDVAAAIRQTRPTQRLVQYRVT